MDALGSQLTDINTLATHSALSAWAWGSDFLIVIIIFSALFLFAWYMGRGPFIALLVSLYAGYALYSTFPYAALLPAAPPLVALGVDMAVYVVLSGIAYLILRRAIVSDFVTIGLFGLAILSIAGAGFLLALAYNLFPVHDVYSFAPALDVLFAPKQYFFWWFAAPLIGLFILAR